MITRDTGLSWPGFLTTPLSVLVTGFGWPCKTGGEVAPSLLSSERACVNLMYFPLGIVGRIHRRKHFGLDFFGGQRGEVRRMVCFYFTK